MSDETRELSFAQAVNEAIQIAMSSDERVICYGLGVTDPKGVFGTTSGLVEKFGQKRVFDVPTSENAFTGVGIGASMTGLVPIMTHQRLDFFLLAVDQLVNAAAKWHFMFGDQVSIPITIRLIIGRGWGQGPTHSQSLQSWFAHMPGIKVLMPSNAYDAKGLLLSSIFDPNPTIILEHRWLHGSLGNVPSEDYRVDIGSAAVVKSGKDLTIVASSYLIAEAKRAAGYLAKHHDIQVEIIDARSIKPFDWETVFRSVEKTGHLLCLDTGPSNCSVSSDICAKVTSKLFKKLKTAPEVVGMPNIPEPTSFGLTKEFYIDAKQISEASLTMLKGSGNFTVPEIPGQMLHDVPGEWFRGPF